MPKNGDSAFLIARSIFDSNLWEGDPHLLKLWIYLLGRATFKKNSPECGILGTTIRQIKEDNAYTTEPPELIRKHWGHKKILKMLNKLEDQKRIETKRTPGGTLVKIVKYREYQDFGSYKRTQRERKENAKGTPTPIKPLPIKPLISANKVKKVKNVKKVQVRPRKKYTFSDEHLKLSELFINLLKKNKPDYVFRGKNYQERWANEVRLMEQEDKRNLPTIKLVIEATATNTFWKKNILSVEKLRSHFDELEMEMKENKQGFKKNLPEDWENFKKAKIELERLASEDKIYKWLKVLPENIHGKLGKFLRRIYPQGKNFGIAQARYEREKRI